nr:H499 [uncultured bacterium]
MKAIHSLAFWMIQTAIFYLIYKGIRRETDAHAGVALAIAGGESLIYAGNGFRCPLTKLAEDLGAESGQVTDIFLPKWLASNIANIYVPLLAAGSFLHARNLVALRRSRNSRLPSIT